MDSISEQSFLSMILKLNQDVSQSQAEIVLSKINDLSLITFYNAFNDYYNQVQAIEKSMLNISIIEMLSSQANLSIKDGFSFNNQQMKQFLIEGVRLINAFRYWLTEASLNYRITSTVDGEGVTADASNEKVISWMNLFQLNNLSIQSDNAIHLLESKIKNEENSNYQQSIFNKYQVFEKFITTRPYTPIKQANAFNREYIYLHDVKDTMLRLYYTRRTGEKESHPRYFLNNDTTSFSLGNFKEWYELKLSMFQEIYGKYGINMMEYMLDDEHPIQYIISGMAQDSKSGVLTGDIFRNSKIMEQIKRGNDKLFSIREVLISIYKIKQGLDQVYLNPNKSVRFISQFLADGSKNTVIAVTKKAVSKINTEIKKLNSIDKK